MKRTVTITEMARICNVTSETIRRWIDLGDIPATKTRGGHRRIDYSDFLAFIQQRGIQPKSDLENGNKTVLLIGEDADYLEEEIISSIGIPPKVHFELAEDSVEAGYKLAVLQPDIIIIDPDADGLDMQHISKVIRSDPFTRDSIIFILSDRNPDDSIFGEFEGLVSYELKDLADLAKLESLLEQL